MVLGGQEGTAILDDHPKSGDDLANALDATAGYNKHCLGKEHCRAQDLFGTILDLLHTRRWYLSSGGPVEGPRVAVIMILCGVVELIKTAEVKALRRVK